MALQFFSWLTDALDFLQAKQAVTPAEYKRLSALDKPKAFAVSGVTSRVVLGQLKRELVKSVEAGETPAQYRQRVARIASIPRAQAENLVRTSTHQAYMAGMDATLKKPHIKAAFGYVVYVATRDTRTRPTHRLLGRNGGFVCSVDDPAYSVLQRALSDHGCRCSLISLTEKQAKARGIKTYSDLPSEVITAYG